MLQPDQKVVQAAQRLIRDPDFGCFLEWLENCRQAEIKLLTDELDDTRIHLGQGRLQAIRHIKDLTSAEDNPSRV